MDDVVQLIANLLVYNRQVHVFCYNVVNDFLTNGKNQQLYKMIDNLHINNAIIVIPMVVGVQTESAVVSVVGVQTDISRVQVVCETTYASVATQAGAGEVGADGDSVMGGVGVPDVGPWPVVGVEGLVRAQALLIHGVDCRRGVGALLAMAQRLRVGECSVRGVRWLLGVGRRWGKCLSSVVVYLDHPVEVQGHSVWFGSALHPVEHYVFGR